MVTPALGRYEDAGKHGKLIRQKNKHAHPPQQHEVDGVWCGGYGTLGKKRLAQMQFPPVYGGYS